MTNLNDDHGRTDRLTESEHVAYWHADPKTRQEQLRGLYDNRDAADRYATSRDYNARELEIAAIAAHVPSGDVVDLGCGNGYTLISLAVSRGEVNRFVGVDFSEKLIAGAQTLLGEMAVQHGPKFVCADAIQYVAEMNESSIDCFITERFLLNMPDEKTQRNLIRGVYRVLKPGGRFLMCEGSMEGFRNLNALRRSVGLGEIAETSADNLSAIRFEDAEIEAFVTEGVGFRLLHKLGFATYFVISRVFHPLLIAPETPRFRSKINDLARQVQMGLPFAPGVGSNVVWVLEKPLD
jgi:ubiquinone/menaquinone biosynthesis C-methylase UbiE